MKCLKYLAGLLGLVYIFSIGNFVYADNKLEPIKRIFVVEWDVVSPNNVNIPKLSKLQLIDKVKKIIKNQQAFQSWEAKYTIIFRQHPRKQGNRVVPEFTTSSQVHMISNGAKWFYEEQKETKTANESSCVNTRFVSNGKIISIFWPDRQDGQVQSANQAVSVGQPTLADFLTSFPSESLTRKKSFPEILDILETSNTKLLPWYTRVGNQICYVLECKATLQHPLFRNREEVENWKKANPKEAEAWSKAGRYGLVINIDSRAKPGDIREIETTTRLAVSPQLGFVLVRWAFGYGTNSGNIQGLLFPKEEIKYTDFCKIDEDIFVLKVMEYAKYAIDPKGERQITHETQILLEEFSINRQYSPDFFEVSFPVGYSVVDSDRGISYTIGDSQKKIDALITAAKARNDFYNKLQSEEAPDLEYSEWINSKQIKLTDQKGRPIILHFWGIGCVPCMRELPQLQKQYGNVLKNTSSPLFISIHPFANDNELRQLKKVVEKNGITFPVMVDAPDIEGRSWGKTFKKYMVFGIPTNVNIDENGHFVEIDKDIINNPNFWLNKPMGPKN
jgi:thiol-disulfide isomerase/thioredoxin